MKTGPDALGTAENEFGSKKTKKRDPTHLVQPKMSLSAHNMKKGPDALGTAENESERTKYEKGT
jgi:hypothetical protein